MNEESKKAAEKAMNLLLRQDRTEKELRDRLKRAGFSEKAVSEAMDYVSGYGYIDDFRYAANYLSLNSRKRSRKELRYKLLDRGVPPDIISEAFRDYTDEDEKEALRCALKKRMKGGALSECERPERDKHMAYLARKGYPVSSIRSVMAEME